MNNLEIVREKNKSEGGSTLILSINLLKATINSHKKYFKLV